VTFDRSKWYGAIPKVRGVGVQVQRSEFRGKARLDIREHYEFRPGDPDSARPTKKGISIPIRDLPRLMKLLNAAEADALRLGLLELEDYDEAGIPGPAELLEAGP
jgi:hypothetical protein